MATGSARARVSVGSLAYVLAGTVVLGLCVRAAWRTERFLSRATRCEGVIAVATAHPTVRFATTSGKTVWFVQNGFVTGKVGRSVPVAYDAGDPAGSARVVTVWTTWVEALWLVPAGLGLLLSGLTGQRPERPGRRA